jgi:PIN domain nuclease of toxin-antitoxin system
MSGVVADTHAAVWYLLESENLSSKALAVLDQTTQEGDLVYVASISVVEVIYLVEKGRLPAVAMERLHRALSDPDAGVVLVPLDLAVAQAIQQIPRDIVPDMPDRIMAATALHLDLPLVTRDGDIQAAGIKTIW